MDSLKPKTPKEARLLGLKTYFTGKPCKRGGIAERRLNGDCLCNSCVDFTKKLKAKWGLENKEKAIAWRKANPEKMHFYKMQYQQRNRELQNKRIAKWKQENPHKVLADTHRYQATKKKAKPTWYDEFDDFVMEEAASLCKAREQKTGIAWHIDHMIPLKSKIACGLHWHKNLQVIPKKLNIKKVNRMIFTEPNQWIEAL